MVFVLQDGLPLGDAEGACVADVDDASSDSLWSPVSVSQVLPRRHSDSPKTVGQKDWNCPKISQRNSFNSCSSPENADTSDLVRAWSCDPNNIKFHSQVIHFHTVMNFLWQNYFVLSCAGLTPQPRGEKCFLPTCLTDHWSWGWLLWLRTGAGTFQLSVLHLFCLFWIVIQNHPGVFASVCSRWMCSVTVSRVWSCLRVDLHTLQLSCIMWCPSLTLLQW